MVTGFEFAFAYICKLGSRCQNFVGPFQKVVSADGVGADVFASRLEDSHLNLIDIVDVSEYFQST